MRSTRSGALLTGLVIVALSLRGSVTAQERPAAVMLEEAQYVEQVEGDLERAIALYRELVASRSSTRDVKAKAQLHIGLCYEKLGLSEARQAYRDVIDGFPEQRNVVAVAQERLASLAQELAELRREPTFTKIEIASRPRNGVLAPDGSRLAFVSDGAVWVVPLEGGVDPSIAGEPVRIAEVPGIWDYRSQMAWSADGEWIAVNGGGDAHNAVHVLPFSGGDPRTIQVPPRRGHAWSNRISLSSDGQRLAFSGVEPGRELDLAWDTDRLFSVATEGGEPEQMASFWSSMPAFSPDGKFIAFVGYRERDDWQNEEGASHDGDLWVVPASGGAPVRLAQVDGRLRGPVWSPDGRYIAAHHEPLAGNSSDEVWVYPLTPGMSSAGDPTQIALPRESGHILAGWTPNEEIGVFIESETHHAIYTVTAAGGRAVQVSPEGGGSYYPRWSPDGDRIYLRWFFAESQGSRVRDIYLAGYETTAYVPATGGEAVPVLPVQSERELGLVIPGGGHSVSPDGKRIVVSAAQLPWDPNEGLDIWTVPLDGGRPTRLTNDASGEAYPCWSPDGQWITFSGVREDSEQADSRAVYVVPAGGGEIRQVTSGSDEVGGGAIAFSPDGERIAFFSGDAIRTIPVRGGRSRVLVAGVQSGRHSQLAYSPDGTRIAHDAEGMIWITAVGVGVAQELRTGLPEGARIGDFSWSPDGEKIAFVGEIGGEAEFWLISDFLPEGW